MKAIIVQNDKSLSWSDVSAPVIRSDEVLVRVCAAGVNRADLLQREGNYPPPPGCPDWMGLEISGVIEAAGEEAKEKSNWKCGDKVCALLGGGGYAEYAAVRYDMLMPIPTGLNMVEAASLPEAYATAYLNLIHEAHLTAGQTLFVSAGASGLASVAIPLAKAFGARVITSVRRDEQVKAVEALGADRVIQSTRHDVADAFAEEDRNGQPICAVMDCLGGELPGNCIPYMARGGYWILIATLSGTETTVPLRALLTKGLHLVGSTLRSRDPSFKAKLLAELTERVWPMLSDGRLKPCIYKVFPITEADQAQAVLRHGGHNGKVILKVSEP